MSAQRRAGVAGPSVASHRLCLCGVDPCAVIGEALAPLVLLSALKHE